eukprot:2080068-Alexandrium_andersonii.AAC.1
MPLPHLASCASALPRLACRTSARAARRALCRASSPSRARNAARGPLRHPPAPSAALPWNSGARCARTGHGSP